METSEATKTPEIKQQVQTFGRERLLPGAYTLDLSVVKDVSVKVNEQLTTFGDAYCKLRDSKIKEIPLFHGPYLTEQGEIKLSCDWTIEATMRELIELARQGIDPHTATWYYYDHDVSQDADESYSFFVVHSDKLVSERSNFGQWEPRVLKRRVDNDPIWHSHPYFDEAYERYWYHKFYSETLTGKLMVLRPDEPILYHYERPQTRDVMREVQFVTLAKIYRLLMIAVLLSAAIAFPSVREYLVIPAGLLGIDFLWLCWTTRKVGAS